jgi:hypothetical protein
MKELWVQELQYKLLLFDVNQDGVLDHSELLDFCEALEEEDAEEAAAELLQSAAKFGLAVLANGITPGALLQFFVHASIDEELDYNVREDLETLELAHTVPKREFEKHKEEQTRGKRTI